MITPDSRILLVDDLNLMRMMLRKYLTQLGYRAFEEAVDGEDAIAKLTKGLADGNPFTLVFLDWNMPKKSGLEVVEYCRANPALNDLIIIMVTAEAEKKNVLEALKKGANDYVVKPVAPNILTAKMKAINEMLNKKKVG